jgi:predicted nuclease of predicted toxin-antitoxin system
MYWCRSCEYKSKRKFNLQKHITNVHKRDATDDELIHMQNTTQNMQITTDSMQNTTKCMQNTTKSMQITTQNMQITTLKNKKISACPKCSKIFKSFQNLQKHQEICKGVSNPLECHYCHRIFSAQQAKSRHLKICKIKEVHNLIQNNSIVNNNQTNMQTNQTNNYIINYYPPSRHHNNNKFYNDNDFETHIDVTHLNDFGKEDTSYIDSDKMKAIALNYDFKAVH